MEQIKIDEQTRKLDKKTIIIGYMSENKIENIKFEIPDKYNNYNKKACFRAGKKEFSLLIGEDNILTLTSDITKFKQVDMSIEFFSDDIVARTSVLRLIFRDTVAGGDVLPSEPKVIILNELIQQVNNLDVDLVGNNLTITKKDGTKKSVYVKGDTGPQGPKGDNYEVNEEDLKSIAKEITDNANSDFNQNATAKTTEFNTNASTKLQEYNTNADNKIAEYDLHSQELDNKIIDTRNELERVKNDVLETGTDTDTFVHLEDSAMAEYQELEVDGVCEQKTTSGKNILQLTTDKETYNYQNTHTIEDNIFIGIPSSSWAQTIYKIYIKPNTQYTFSSKIILEGTNLPSVWRITIKNEDETNIFSSSVNIVNSKISYSFNSGENNFILISFWSRIGENSSGVTKTIYSEIQLEEGLTATDYEPYTGGKPSPSPDYPQEIKTIENSLKTTSNNGEQEDSENYLFSQIEVNLPEGEFIGKTDDTYKDTLKVEYNEEDGQYHLNLYKNIGKVVLDGSEDENWAMYGSQPVYYILQNDMKNTYTAGLISDYFTSKYFDNVVVMNNGTFMSQGNKTLYFKNSNTSTLAEWKNWLSTHNTKVYYALENPYVVDLGVVDMPITYNEITNLFTDSDLLPQINAKYYRNFITTIQNLQVNEKALKQEIVDINTRLSALETATTNVASESEVVE